MKKAALFVCLLAGMAFASTKSFTVTLFEPATIGGTEMKAGDYKAELQGQTLVIKHGHDVTQTGVKVENADSKYPSTEVRYNTVDGKNKVQEIRVGGTNMKLVLQAQDTGQKGE